MNIQKQILHTMFLKVFTLKKGFLSLVKNYSLTEMEAKFIYHIGEGKNRTCDLIGYFKKHKSTIRQKTKALEDKGFITLEPDLNDKRERNIFLTDKGKSFYSEIEKNGEIFHSHVFKNFTKKEKDELFYLLNKLEIKNDEECNECC